MSGLKCQKWNTGSPHTVEFKPVGDDDHNFCRYCCFCISDNVRCHEM